MLDINKHLIRTSPSIRSRISRYILKNYLAKKFAIVEPIEVQRKTIESVARFARLPKGTSIKNFSMQGINAEWISASNVTIDQKLSSSQNVMLYMHGGGFFLGSCNTNREFAARISEACNISVLQFDYRLAPEYQYPAANEDCVTAYQWLLDQGYRSENIVIGGESAGACLALMTLISLRDNGLPLPSSAILLSLLGDAITLDGESYQSRDSIDPWLDSEMIKYHLSHYLGSKDLKPTTLSPIKSNLDGLPPLLIQLGNDEVLLSDSTRLAERAEKAGVEVTLEIWENMWHAFQTFAGVVPEAKAAIQHIGDFVGCHVGIKKKQRVRSKTRIIG